MPSLTASEQAKLEHSLALAHRHVFGAMQLLAARDDYEACDDLRAMSEHLFELLQAQLKRGGHLRTRVPKRVQPSPSVRNCDGSPPDQLPFSE